MCNLISNHANAPNGGGEGLINFNFSRGGGVVNGDGGLIERVAY